MPRPMTRTATPKATTDVNSDARRNDDVMTESRRGSSWSSWAYVCPSAISAACFLITIASL